MHAVELSFLAGRFHATPWGRNVNEGEPEWPPSPFRLARALIDVAWRKRPRIARDRDRLRAVLVLLTEPGAIVTPPARPSHIRFYQRQGDKDPAKRQKIFDPFMVVDHDAPVTMIFDGKGDERAFDDLADLLGLLDYFGRSESWVAARLVREVAAAPEGYATWCPGSGGSEAIELACLRPEAEAPAVVASLRASTPSGGRGRGRRRPSLPNDWLDLVALSTGELLKLGLSGHPAIAWRRFVRQGAATRPRHRRRKLRSGFREARYALHAPVLPRVVDTVPVAEQVRRRLMGIHKNIMGGDESRVSLCFAGKTPDGGYARGHLHARYWPLDDDGDGFIDHLVVQAGEPFDDSELLALDRLTTLWQRHNRGDVRLVLEALNRVPATVASTRFVSATPYVTHRHPKRHPRGYAGWIDDEIRRELRLLDLPQPVTMEPLARTTGQHEIRWPEFVRCRKGNRPVPGHGRVLIFDEPVQGPFALGALSHFGLGLFVPGS